MQRSQDALRDGTGGLCSSETEISGDSGDTVISDVV